jgi:sugar phosphate isomerase/epimerase
VPPHADLPRRLVGRAVKGELCGAFAQLLQLEMHRRQRRDEVAQRLDVVEAGHGHVVGLSSPCRGGFFTGPDRRAALEENRRTIEETATLAAAGAAGSAPVLVLVAGGLPDGDRDLPGARARAADAALADDAAAAGVVLAIEPMHPVYAADRGVVSTLSQALDVAEQFPADRVGVVDTFHVWWDPQLAAQVRRAGPRIASYQVCDWITPLPADTLLARG